MTINNFLKSTTLLAGALGLALSMGLAVADEEPTITEVSVSFGPDQITITGQNLDFGLLPGGAPVVTLGEFANPLAIVGTPTATKIVVDCPLNMFSVPLCPDGDFLLTVAADAGDDDEQVVYDLTIGAVGLQARRPG